MERYKGMIKKILVAQDGSEYSKAAFDYGLWLAKRFGAGLTGIYVVDIVALEGPFFHDISASIGFEPFLNFSSKMREVLEAKAKTIMNGFEKACEDSGVSCETVIPFGVIPNEICEAARLADLVVMGKHGVNEKYEHGLFGSITEGVIRKCSKPVLVVPKAFGPITKPLLAYDGSLSASKAMHTAAEWAKALDTPLTVVSVSRPDANGEALKDAESYIKPYAVKASYAQLKGDAPAEIERYYRESGSDLIIMGAMHHSRLVELVLGSTTEHVMRAVAGPLLLER